MANKAVSKDAPSKSKTPSRTAAGMAPPMAYSPFMELRHRMDRLFDDVFHGSGFPMMARDWPGFGRDLDWPRDLPGRGTGQAASLADVKFDIGEDDKAIEISAEMPGMDEDDVDLTLSDGVLTIKGEKKAEHEEKDKDYHLTERRYGAFQRSFRLPDTVDEGKVKASFEKGVLKVVLPKSTKAKAKTKKISISKS